MRIAVQLHKADPKYAELEVALEMVSAAALAYRHIRHLFPCSSSTLIAKPPYSPACAARHEPSPILR